MSNTSKLNSKKLQRSISDQTYTFNNEIKSTFLINIKNESYNNVTIAHDPGYSYNKSMIVNGKSMQYTEDRNINFSFYKYHVIGTTDGHGGSSRMSILASGSFPIYFTENVKKFHTIEKALLQTFDDIHNLAQTKGGISGTTLNVCVIDKVLKRAYVANLGDSVTNIFRRNDTTFESIFRTVDHDASNVNEQLRLKKLFDNKINFEYSNRNGGSLYAVLDYFKIMVVGAIGNFHYPKNFIRRIPDISTIDLKKDDIIICSSDGFYESYDPSALMLCACRNEQEIINDLNELYDSPTLAYDSQTLAYNSQTLAYDSPTLAYNSPTLVYDSPTLVYDSPTLAQDLMDKHVHQIAESIGWYDDVLTIIKTSRDNNMITTFVVK